MRKLTNCLLILLGLTTAASSTAGLVWQADDYVMVPEYIQEGAGFGMMMRTKQLVNRHPAYVNILFDSRGGSVDTSTESFVLMLRELRLHQVAIECVVVNKAYSMAVMILAECSNIYAVDGSVIMWHGIRNVLAIPLNQFEMETELAELRRDDSRLWGPWRARIANDGYFDENFKSERLVPVRELSNRLPRLLKLTTLEIAQ